MVTQHSDGSTPDVRIGRPRSEQAREAVLHAVDDLLLEVGYAAMSMKGIAERAGVSRQTVYRWWTTKAEILFEASVLDAQQELEVALTGAAADVLTRYLDAVRTFLTRSPAGAAYRALFGEAQHDQAVAELLESDDVLLSSARSVLAHLLAPTSIDDPTLDRLAASLVGPTFFLTSKGKRTAPLDLEGQVAMFLPVLEAAASNTGRAPASWERVRRVEPQDSDSLA